MNDKVNSPLKAVAMARAIFADACWEGNKAGSKVGLEK